MTEPSAPPDRALPDSQDVRLLTEIGFLAAVKGDVMRAEKIFSALLLFRPGKAFAHVGLAVALMNAGRAGDAVAHLTAATPDPGEDAEMVQTMLGLALQLDGRSHQSQQVLRKLVGPPAACNAASDSARLARKLLGEHPEGTNATPSSFFALYST